MPEQDVVQPKSTRTTQADIAKLSATGSLSPWQEEWNRGRGHRRLCTSMQHLSSGCCQPAALQQSITKSYHCRGYGQATPKAMTKGTAAKEQDLCSSCCLASHRCSLHLSFQHLLGPCPCLPFSARGALPQTHLGRGSLLWDGIKVYKAIDLI